MFGPFDHNKVAALYLFLNYNLFAWVLLSLTMAGMGIADFLKL